jgi:class 3 adenylate cyclase
MAALPDGSTTALALKVAIASGPACRLVVGDSSIQLIDTLVGATLACMAAAEHLASKGEILIDQPPATAIGDTVQVAEWRVDAETGERFAVLAMTDNHQPLADNQSDRPQPA